MTLQSQPAIPRLETAVKEFLTTHCGATSPTIDIVAAPANPGDPDLTVTGRMHFQISGFIDVGNFNVAQGMIERLATGHSEAA